MPDSSAPNPDASAHDGGTGPTLTCPVTGGKFGLPFNAMPAGLAAKYGYEEHECFMAGTAQAYADVGARGMDGKWTVTPSTTAAYKTRLLARRPSDPTKFNGTVFVEWLNVSLGADADIDFGEAHDELMRSGYAWVGVSAQDIGVEGGAAVVSVPNVTPEPLKVWDPGRYGSLSHPGGDYADDIFTQAATSIRGPTDVNPLSGLEAKRIIASGDSQSADRLVEYVNAIHPLVHVFDGFLIHSRTGITSASWIRDDLTVPVMQFETESDLITLNFGAARQPDGPHLRTWEVAGTSHVDQTTADYLKGEGDRFAPGAGVDFASSCAPVNTGQHAYVLQAAIASLTAWVTGGNPPAGTDLIQTGDGGTIVRDAHGNALGGVRSSALDAPIAALSGDNPNGNLLCKLFGSTTSFDTATLPSLYPTHADYVAKVKTAGQAAVAAGHLLQPDEALIEQVAQSAPIPQ